LENRRDKNDKMPKRVWKVVKAKVGKIRVAKAKGRREKKRRRKETERKETEKRKKRNRKRKPKNERMMEVKRVAEEWEIWDKKEETAKSEEEKKLVSENSINEFMCLERKQVKECQ